MKIFNCFVQLLEQIIHPIISVTILVLGLFSSLCIADIPLDPDHFLRLFKDVSPDHRESETTAQAYYRAIDPNDKKSTLNDFKVENNFDGASTENAIYLNAADLGFGRDMYVWENNGSVVSFVQNYGNGASEPDTSISQLLEGDSQTIIQNAINKTGLIATVAMEYSSSVNGPSGDKYTRFYVYDADGNRVTKADLDGRGEKFVPGLCNTCHGGNPRPLDKNGEYLANGNTHASFLPWDLDTFEYSTIQASLFRSFQEQVFREFNEQVLQTNPTVATKELITGWYGANIDVVLLPEVAFNGGYVPPGWEENNNLYQKVIAPNCRACHITRNSALNFSSFEKFNRLSDSVKKHVFERGLMPLANRTYERFWSDSRAVNLLANALIEVDSTLRPDDSPPFVFPGIDFYGSAGQVLPLSATDSLYADRNNTSFNWTLNTQLDAEIVNPAASNASFLTNVPGEHEIELSVVNSLGVEATKSITITVTADGLAEAPVSFDKDMFRVCEGCHSTPNTFAPQFFDPTLSGEKSEEFLYRNIAQRSNVLDPENSMVRLKAIGDLNHGGGMPFMDQSQDIALVRWIKSGALFKTRPLNDDIQDALLFALNDGTISGNNSFASKEVGIVDGTVTPEPNHGNTGGKSVWWTFQSADSGVLSLDTFGSDFDTILAIYEGNADVAILNKKTENDDAAAGSFQSELSLTIEADQKYFIAVDGFNGTFVNSEAASGIINLNWDFTPNPDNDGDGVPDNEDDFPNDPTETNDTDGDGVGDNADVFPNDPAETIDTDGDGIGNNADVFPNDPTETTDTDGDGIGNNTDVFPNDPTETTDTDGDGVGDNADVFPNDPTKSTYDDKKCTLDVDGNASADALTDGLLFIRYMFGIRGESLIVGAVASNCANCSAAELEPILEQCGTAGTSDIDGNGEADALTDGLLIIRYLFGISGNALIESSVANDCIRCNVLEIENYLEGLIP